MSPDDRRRVRQDKSKPLVVAFKAWLEQQLARVSAKASIAEEIRYGLNHWDGLTRFLDDGRIELDTNIVERGTLRGSRPRRGELACIASLIETRLCRVRHRRVWTCMA
jgi:transposase